MQNSIKASSLWVPCLRSTQVRKTSRNSMDGFNPCYGDWRSTTTQALITSMNVSHSQLYFLTRKPRQQHQGCQLLKTGVDLQRHHHRPIQSVHTWIIYSGCNTEVLFCEVHHRWWCIQLLSWTQTVHVKDDSYMFNTQLMMGLPSSMLWSVVDKGGTAEMSSLDEILHMAKCVEEGNKVQQCYEECHRVRVTNPSHPVWTAQLSHPNPTSSWLVQLAIPQWTQDCCPQHQLPSV